MGYAILVNNAPTPIVRGLASITTQLRIADAGEAELRGAAIGAVVDFVATHPASALEGWTSDDLDRWQVYPFDDPAAPDGKQLAGVTLVLTNGVVAATGRFSASPVPQIVKRLPGILALDEAGMIPEIETYMALPGTPSVHKIHWRETPEFHRDSEFIAVIAGVLNVSSAVIDGLFRRAAELA